VTEQGSRADDGTGALLLFQCSVRNTIPFSGSEKGIGKGEEKDPRKDLI